MHTHMFSMTCWLNLCCNCSSPIWELPTAVHSTENLLNMQIHTYGWRGGEWSRKDVVICERCGGGSVFELHSMFYCNTLALVCTCIRFILTFSLQHWDTPPTRQTRGPPTGSDQDEYAYSCEYMIIYVFV